MSVNLHSNDGTIAVNLKQLEQKVDIDAISNLISTKYLKMLMELHTVIYMNTFVQHNILPIVYKMMTLMQYLKYENELDRNY